MCVKSPERCFIQKGQGVLWLFDKMQEYFFLILFSLFIYKKQCKKNVSRTFQNYVYYRRAS